MNSRTIDVVTDWETVAAPDGYEGLHQLSDSEFSGAVSAGTTWAFFLNGRVVGVFEGEIGDFEDATLTAYRAADPSLPLLFAMQERGGETRAQYYTNETPLSDADATLESGGFTGYVELSENVLSGDYYVVYHGGKSMSAAFVGSSERLITGEEAFERAADEVGIYEVKDVDVELVELPELPDAAAADGDVEPVVDGEEATDKETDDADATAEDEGTDDADDAGEAGIPADDTPADGEAGADETDGDPAEDADGGAERGDPSAAPTTPETPAGEPADPTADTDAATDDPEAPRADAAAAPAADADVEAAEAAAVDDHPSSAAESGARSLGAERAERTGGDAEAAARAEPPTPEGSAATDAEGDGVLADEERWREARTIPSLDPGRSNGEASVRGNDAAESQPRERSPKRQRRAREARERAAARRERQRGQRRSEGDQGTDRLRKRLSRARDRLESLEAERDDLAEDRDEYRERVEELEAAREKQRERIDELESERERLEAEVERLESEIESGATEGRPSTDAPAEKMSPDRALAGTNLFVRYDRKGEATLAHAHDGKAAREDVSENLRLEHHTTFETDGLVVDERPYEEFLRESTEYAFAEWVVTDLLYEIGETGNRSKLGGVFDAIPDIDRVEIAGTVDLAGEEDGDRRDFDVIFRDKMGDPLFVADINASRNATTEAMVGSLVENTGTVAESAESLSAGFYVTESFYEPGALENVAEATGGGLLSRSSKLSYVKLSRKRGYHLCLVEARNGEFHLNVPDL